MTERDIAKEMDEVGRGMTNAMAEAADGEIAYFNTAGPIGQAALVIIEGAVDADELTGFVTDDGGDCLFTATYVMAALAKAKTIAPFRLCTGYFDHPDLAPDRVVHAWLEVKLPASDEPIVVNVSNPRSKPVYTMYRSNYFMVNFMKNRVQSVTATEFARALRAYRNKHGDDVEIIEFTKVLLKKTRTALGRELKAVARRKAQS